MNKRQHKHHIDVETDEQLVTVTIGADGGVPGGFAKLFNRVVDSEIWAKLSDAARAAYVPLVRFADHRNQFRIRMGRAAIMKYTGLSQSAIKRAMKDLMANRLVVVVELGGVNSNGENEPNTYQLLVPAEARLKPPAGSAANPPGGLQRTPSRFTPEPPAGSMANPGSGQVRPPEAGQKTGQGGVGSGPLLRNKKKENSKTDSTPLPGPAVNSPRLQLGQPSADRAAVLLEEKGVEGTVARQLADAYPYDRIIDVIAAMEWRKSRGKCENPGGFIRDALVKQWQTPNAVVEARARAEVRAKAEEAERLARASAQLEQTQLNHEELRIERLIDSLDDEELAMLALSVLEKYQGNVAVTGVLTRKPPRQCRLMKMEIAAMLSPTSTPETARRSMR